DFKLTITKEVSGTTQTEEVDSLGVSYSYLRWYEVENDQANNLVDIGFLNAALGEFIFPNQKPFDPDDENSIFYDDVAGRADSLFVDSWIYTDPFSTYSSQFTLKFQISGE
ncbi:MAG: hypothetical protein GQ534_01900, partial [Candidatus Delongbacteria bacterium]|nr:hypothetical protein [Candidatus Delongbacteria bacterium]